MSTIIFGAKNKEVIMNEKGVVFIKDKTTPCMIKPELCPFCGGDLFTIKTTYAPYIKCKGCGTMKTGDTLDECMEKWNRRVKE